MRAKEPLLTEEQTVKTSAKLKTKTKKTRRTTEHINKTKEKIAKNVDKVSLAKQILRN